MTAFSSWEAVRDAPVDQLTETIRSGGLAVVKAHRIQAVLQALTNSDGRVELPDFRRMRRKRAVDLLTSLPGVGRKTVACVLLFGWHGVDVPAPKRRPMRWRLRLIRASTTHSMSI